MPQLATISAVYLVSVPGVNMYQCQTHSCASAAPAFVHIPSMLCRPSFSDILVRLEQLLQLSPAQLHDSSYPVEPGGALQHHNEPPAALPQAEEQRDRAKHARNDLLPPTQQQRQQQDRLKSSTSAQGGELYQGYL